MSRCNTIVLAPGRFRVEETGFLGGGQQRDGKKKGSEKKTGCSSHSFGTGRPGWGKTTRRGGLKVKSREGGVTTLNTGAVGKPAFGKKACLFAADRKSRSFSTR